MTLSLYSHGMPKKNSPSWPSAGVGENGVFLQTGPDSKLFSVHFHDSCDRSYCRYNPGTGTDGIGHKPQLDKTPR